MKKIYLLSLAALLSTGGFAQTKLKISTGLEKGAKRSASTSHTGSRAVTGSIVSTNNYTSGTQDTLDFVLTLTNTDFEYGDSLAITFPTGITPLSTPNNPFAPITDNDPAQFPEAFNGINGQTISWGDNDNSYGGIEALGNTSYNFSVVVDIAAISGAQTATFHLSGDGFGANPMDLNGTIIISENVAADMAAVEAIIPTACQLGSEQVYFWFKNNGLAAASNFDVSYIVNGGTPVTETFANSVAPGDTVLHIFTTLLDMTTPGIYNLEAVVGITGDGNQLNDTTSYVAASIAPANAPYSSSFENTPTTDLLGWTVEDADSSGLSFGLATVPHTGTYSIRAFENNIARASDDWLFSTCLNFEAGKTYRVYWWDRLTTGYGGELGVFVGLENNSTAMTQTLRATAALTANSIWRQDSATFTVATTDVYYIGIQARNLDTALSIALRVDDFQVKEVASPVSIKENKSNAISIYPNPANDRLNIVLNGQEANVSVYDVTGKVISSEKMIGNSTMNLSSFSAGTYFVKVQTAEKVYNEKIVIKK